MKSTLAASFIASAVNASGSNSTQPCTPPGSIQGGSCEPCKETAQCSSGYCCPFKKTCISSASQPCRGDYADCQPICQDAICTTCSPTDGSDYNFDWGLDTCASGGSSIRSIEGLCVDLPAGDTSNGNLLWMWECNGADSQQWDFQNGQLVYLADPSKCVDLLGDDSSDGNQVSIWDCNGGDSQQWGYDVHGGTIYLSNSASDATKCLDNYGSQNWGSPIVIWDCNAVSNQGWWPFSFLPTPMSSQSVSNQTHTEIHV